MRLASAFVGLAGLLIWPGVAMSQQQLPPVVVTPPKKVAAKKQPIKKALAPSTAAEVGAHLASGAPNVGGGPTPTQSLASEITVPGTEVNARPVTRPGEVLETAPGLIVTQHSGEGKANQYFLRGYNLDHGTDMAIYVDDMPINMRTHAHGQGYADLNWLMPETVNGVLVRKGPYFADEGDFGSAGNLHVSLVDSVNKNLAQVTIGSFGYERLFAMSSARLGEGNLLVATEVATYNGPWVNPDEMRKLNGIMRYSQGTATDGSITGMATPTAGTRRTKCPSAPLPLVRSPGLVPRSHQMVATPRDSPSRGVWPRAMMWARGKPTPT